MGEELAWNADQTTALQGRYPALTDIPPDRFGVNPENFCRFPCGKESLVIHAISRRQTAIVCIRHMKQQTTGLREEMS